MFSVTDVAPFFTRDGGLRGMRIGQGHSEPIGSALIRAAQKQGTPALYTQFATATGVTLMGAQVDKVWYLSWFGVTIALWGVRVALAARLGRALRDPEVELGTLRQLQKLPITFLIVTAGLWAALAWFRLPVESAEMRLTIVVVLSALCGGAVGVMSATLWTGRVYITLLLLPASIRLLDNQDGHAMVGVLGMVFWIVMLIAHRGAYRLLVDSIQLGHDKARLVAALQSRTEEVETANRELETRVAARTAELSEMAARAETANRAKSEFLATMSHELRTPLNGVIGMAQVMSRDHLQPAQRARLDVIQSSATALLEIINEVLDISKIESGRMTLDPDAFDVGALAKGLERVYAMLAREKNLGFSLTMAPMVDTARWGDAQKLRQILSNLISNAVKFTHEGEVTVHIDFDGDDLLCSVCDTGIGIPEAMMSAVFDRFVQVDGSFSRRSGGAGLGLAICRELATLMGGAISLTARPEGGSRFDLRLPLPPAEAPLPIVDASADVAAPDGQIRVLIADDHPGNRLVLQSLLGQLGIASSCATNGDEAVALWETQSWDAILMDVHMPGVDGLEATRRIRTRELETGRAHTPILAVTASVLTHEIAFYQSIGMDGVVAKPIQVETLLEGLRSSVERSEAA